MNNKLLFLNNVKWFILNELFVISKLESFKKHSAVLVGLYGIFRTILKSRQGLQSITHSSSISLSFTHTHALSSLTRYLSSRTLSLSFYHTHSLSLSLSLSLFLSPLLPDVPQATKYRKLFSRHTRKKMSQKFNEHLASASF